MTINKVVQSEEYQMPSVKDLFAALCGGQHFTKIDLKQAYTQIMLDEDCKKYTTINTLLGLFQYTRLPFEVSTAPAIFQRVIEGTLAGLPNILVRVDDILATGPAILGKSRMFLIALKGLD